jgi:hypothetical protein
MTTVLPALREHYPSLGKMLTESIPDRWPYAPDGAAALAWTMFDELRVTKNAIDHVPSVADDMRPWAIEDLPESMETRNARGSALAYGILVGHIDAGLFPPETREKIVGQFEPHRGARWAEILDQFLARGFTCGVGDLLKLSREFDRYATTGLIPAWVD